MTTDTTPNRRTFYINVDRLGTDRAYGSLIAAYTAAQIEAEAGTLTAAAVAELAEIGTHPRDEQLRRARAWLVSHHWLTAAGALGRTYASARQRHEKRIAARKSDEQLTRLMRAWPNMTPEGRADVVSIANAEQAHRAND